MPLVFFSNSWIIYLLAFMQSYLRLLYQSPIKNLGFYFQNSYLSVTYPHVTINDKKVAELLPITGQKKVLDILVPLS
ncbi:MAG TPA: hypothetical protein PKW07_08325 [Syntrophorhabdaceae bacterium]|nr:hypothetical protein [Syntrophorhabdaceae bacterium]